MLNHYNRQRTYTDKNGNIVSSRYEFFTYTEDKNIVLDKEMSLDEISYKYYGTPLYYWLIGEANNIKDPFKKLRKGTTVKVPVLWLLILHYNPYQEPIR